ncbi:hypothetical protein BHE74_00048960 [Ensete ventricosum]|nr:hypothetical protein BHE74_00048960 [Ensete ventricosum]
MACTTQSIISANSCVFPSHSTFRRPRWVRPHTKLFAVNTSSGSDDSDCNTEECAPDKEVGIVSALIPVLRMPLFSSSLLRLCSPILQVGKVSMEWLAGEKTKVVGTFPPRNRGWTGYVEKDTAGQTNIYSVENNKSFFRSHQIHVLQPAVYIADSAISSGTAGTSTEGSENTLAINAGLALISIAAASSILLQVSKSQPQVQTTEYSGPPLSYYINKFKPVQIVEASAPAAPQTSAPVEASVPPESLSSSTVEDLVPTSESPLSTTMQDGSKPEAVPEVQVELSRQVDAQSASASSVS